MTPKDNDHPSPCDSFVNFRKMIIATMGLQAIFVIASLSLAVSTQNRVSVLAEQQIQLRERQRMIEQKADEALSNSTKALTISGKSEADIAWIREGFTELKMLVRNAINDKGGP